MPQAKVASKPRRSRTERNPYLMNPKTVELSGSQRAFIMRWIDRTPPKARTVEEIDLYDKVARD